MTTARRSVSKNGIDWNQVYTRVQRLERENPCSDLTGVVACDWLNDPPGQTIFTQGSADILDVNQWHWNEQLRP